MGQQRMLQEATWLNVGCREEYGTLASSEKNNAQFQAQWQKTSQILWRLTITCLCKPGVSGGFAACSRSPWYGSMSCPLSYESWHSLPLSIGPMQTDEETEHLLPCRLLCHLVLLLVLQEKLLQNTFVDL